MEMLNDTPRPGGRRRGVARMKRHSLKTDMTPMVDLGFLLITFFVMTVKLSEPVEVRLNMPHDGSGTTIGESYALTVLLDKDNTIYYYHGYWDQAFAKNEIRKTTFAVKDGLGKIIREKQQALDQVKNMNPKMEGREGLMLLIKASEEANYGNIIDLLDETIINKIGKYALLKPEKKELEYIRKQL
jgi:biopolymer transport protein ExbD